MIIFGGLTSDSPVCSLLLAVGLGIIGFLHGSISLQNKVLVLNNQIGTIMESFSHPPNPPDHRRSPFFPPQHTASATYILLLGYNDSPIVDLAPPPSSNFSPYTPIRGFFSYPDCSFPSSDKDSHSCSWDFFHFTIYPSSLCSSPKSFPFPRPNTEAFTPSEPVLPFPFGLPCFPQL